MQAVSYTHLDVYKRQVESMEDLEKLLFLWQEETNERMGEDTVSLDGEITKLSLIHIFLHGWYIYLQIVQGGLRLFLVLIKLLL